MMHDPFQNTILGSYYGTPTPIGLQYPQTPGINPAATLNPLLGLSPLAQAGGIQQFGQSPYGQSPYGQSPYGQNPGQGLINPQQLQQLQQLQLASLLASQAVAQNPILASLLSNPLIAASLQNGVSQLGVHPQIGQYPQIGQMGSPFGQIGSPFGQVGYPLAPQSWIGQGGPFGGVQQGFGQINPFQSQLTPRPFQGQGPWGY